MSGHWLLLMRFAGAMVLIITNYAQGRHYPESRRGWRGIRYQAVEFVGLMLVLNGGPV